MLNILVSLVTVLFLACIDSQAHKHYEVNKPTISKNAKINNHVKNELKHEI